MKLWPLCLVAGVIALSGCVETQYIKSVTVKKDASGKIVERIETETVSQPGRGYSVEFEHLKGVQ